MGWVGLFGFAFLVYGILFGLNMPFFLMAIAIFNTVSYFAVYQYGALVTNKKYALVALALQYGISLYEGLTFWYALFFPPETSKFDVIEKVPVKPILNKEVKK